MRKTLGQMIHDNIIAKGFTEKDYQDIQYMQQHNATLQTGISDFNSYCEEKHIKPTWPRYKKFCALEQEKLNIYVNSGGKDDRF